MIDVEKLEDSFDQAISDYEGAARKFKALGMVHELNITLSMLHQAKLRRPNYDIINRINERELRTVN